MVTTQEIIQRIKDTLPRGRSISGTTTASTPQSISGEKVMVTQLPQKKKGVIATDISEGTSVITITEPGKEPVRIIQRAPQQVISGVTGAAVQRPQISEAEAIKLVEQSEALRAQKELANRQQEAASMTRQAPIGITTAATATKEKIPEFAERVKESQKARVSGMGYAPPISKISPKAKEKIGFAKKVGVGVFKDITQAVPDVFDVVFLRTAFTPTSKPTTMSQKELLKQREKIQTSVARDVQAMLTGGLTFGIQAAAAKKKGKGFEEFIKTPEAGTLFRLRERIISRKAEEEAKELSKEREKQIEFLKPRVTQLEEVAKKEQVLSEKIVKEGEVTPQRAEELIGEQKALAKEREQILGEVRQRGITPKEKEIEGQKKIIFESAPLTEDLRKGTSKILENRPKAEKIVAVGGTITSEFAQALTAGATAKATGVLEPVSRILAATPPIIQKGLIGTAVIGTGLRAGVGGYQAAIESPKGQRVAPAILGAGEPVAKVGGFIIGVEPTTSPIQIKTIKIPEGQPGAGQVAVRTFVVKIPFAGEKGVFPILTKAQVGGISKTAVVGGKLVPTGEIQPFYQTTFGVPENAFITPTGEFTPSGAIETKIYLETLKNIPKEQKELIENAYALSKLTAASSKVKVVDETKSPLEVSKGFQKLSPEQQKAATKFLEEETGGRFIIKGRQFGSAASEVQLKTGLGREIKDVDVQFGFKSAEKQAQSLVDILNKVPGSKVSLVPDKPGQIIIGSGKNAVKIFDLHGIDKIETDIEAVKNPFGFNDQGTIRADNININKLTQEGINKLASLSSLNSQGGVPGSTKNRIKDVGDFFTIQEGLTKSLSGTKQTQALDLLTKSKTAALAKFGKTAFEPGQKEILGISPSYVFGSPSSALAALSVPGALNIPSPSIKVSKTSFAAKGVEVSPKINIKPSPSPLSPSLAPSTSLAISYSVPPSISPKISPSLSRSISQSLSPSISPSPSVSPSVSVSPSISPSISISPSPSISPSVSLSPSISASLSPLEPVPPITPLFPAFIPPLTFKRPRKKKREKKKLKTKYVPSITGAVLNIRIAKTPKEIKGFGLSPFQIRGVPSGVFAKTTKAQKRLSKALYGR